MPLPDPEFLVIGVAVGVAAGVLAGLLGVGGGLIIVPALHELFAARNFPAEHLMHLAVASSLASIVFTSLSSTWAHHRRGAVLWRAVTALAPGIVAGAALGALIANQLSSPALRELFGVFACLAALQIGRNAQPQAHRVLPAAPGMLAMGVVIGAVSALVGIGGGTLTVPFLLWCNVKLRNAVATSAACGLPIALAGSIAMMIAGADQRGLPHGSIGYVYWPAALTVAAASIACAPLGAMLAHRLPLPMLRLAFAVLLLVVGLRMIA